MGFEAISHGTRKLEAGLPTLYSRAAFEPGTDYDGSFVLTFSLLRGALVFTGLAMHFDAHPSFGSQSRESTQWQRLRSNKSILGIKNMFMYTNLCTRCALL